MTFFHIKAGDPVIRLMAETVRMPLTVSKVDEKLIHCCLGCDDGVCRGWTFDRLSGAEVDHDLGWGPQYGHTGSRLLQFEI